MSIRYDEANVAQSINHDYQEDTLLSQIYYLENQRVEPIPHTELEAYNRAKNGFKFPSHFEIGSLTYLDLIEISQEQPSVDLKTYKELQLLDREQLLKKAAGIEHFHPTISKADLFFYLTRGWFPKDVNIAEKIKRWNQFEKLLPLSQELILLMYKNQKHFAEAPLAVQYKNIESLVFLYDELLGLRNTPGLISKMAGMDVAIRSKDIDNYIYGKLSSYINAAATQTPYSENRTEVLTFDEVINFNKDEWVDFIKRNYFNQDIPFGTRSDFVMQMYYHMDIL